MKYRRYLFSNNPRAGAWGNQLEEDVTDEELTEVARDFRDGILAGRTSELMCFAVSAPLQGFLSALYGVETSLEEVDFGECNHVWLRLPDGRILDPTADQFGLEPVYLGEVPDTYRRLALMPSSDGRE